MVMSATGSCACGIGAIVKYLPLRAVSFAVRPSFAVHRACFAATAASRSLVPRLPPLPAMDPTFAEVRAQSGSPPLSPSPRPPTRPVGHHRQFSAAAASNGSNGGLLGGPFVTISSPNKDHSPSFSSSSGSRPLSYASAHPARGDPPADDERPAFTLRPRSPTPAQARAAAARARSKSPLPAREAQAIAAAAVPVRNIAQSPRVDGPPTTGTKSSSSAASASAAEPASKSLKPSSASFPSAASSSSSSASTSSSSSKSSAIRAAYQKPSEPVFLNVYDLHPYNQYLHGLGFGQGAQPLRPPVDLPLRRLRLVAHSAVCGSLLSVTRVLIPRCLSQCRPNLRSRVLLRFPQQQRNGRVFNGPHECA